MLLMGEGNNQQEKSNFRWKQKLYYFSVVPLCFKLIFCNYQHMLSECMHVYIQGSCFCIVILKNNKLQYLIMRALSQETLSPESTAQILLSAAWRKADTVRRKRTIISVVLILQSPMPFDLLFVPSLWSITYTACNLFSSQFTYLCWATK